MPSHERTTGAIHDGALYVLEYTDTGGSVRVRRLDPDGRASVLP
jgi:hypothetical protein